MKESQHTMMQHSEVKIRLLKLYLEGYLSVLANSQFTSDINIYDLFCGEGIYENGGEGSPIIILKTILDVYLRGNASGGLRTKFNCFFNDIERRKIEKLREEIEKRKLHHPSEGEIRFSEMDYKELLPLVVNELDILKTGKKAFVFIDPYGYKDISIKDIKKLLQTKKSEVLLFLPTQFMFRFENKGTPECLIEFINELMPVSEWPVSETGIDFIENLTEAFRNNVANYYYVDSFIITRDKNQFFCLFFFTSHILGFEKMLHAKWKIDEEEGRGWSFDSSVNLFAHVPKKPNTLKFERKLDEYLKTGEKGNGELYEFSIRNGHLPTHTNEILRKLQDEGKLETLNADGHPARKNSFYLSYAHFKKEPKKVKFKIL